ncbi:PAS domain-containing protein [Alteromonas lipolytica]|uniref:Aerotaxis receptor Aer n=1 Tax=Alteromonas lipolytica TaxID=1856405 RepID=A0A1E8FGC1_9ALTE|nr:PAS domain-containing protein [Alteromonas lipolytica]OFI34638.1 aerotaxis receptor Aer [Alteromonas lipolytica]GGF52791.1 chemotaxis protein [Alteromonas lipolytica]
MIAVSANAREITFSADELIVSKTDLRGNITYANRHFMRISNFAEIDLLGRPHSIIRHPDMPRGVYHAMWKTLKSKNEFFGFVKNLTSDGDYYWVFANVTPDFNKGNIEGFFSVRRQAPRAALAMITPLYQQMLEIEKRSRKESAPTESWNWLQDHIKSETGLSYEEFIIGLYEQNS